MATAVQYETFTPSTIQVGIAIQTAIPAPRDPASTGMATESTGTNTRYHSRTP